MDIFYNKYIKYKYKYLRKTLGSFNQKGNGPLVEISQEMLEKIAIPSKKAYDTGKDCVAISLYFLGVFGDTMKRIIEYINKYKMGLDDDLILQYIREYESNIIKNYPDLIIDNYGPTDYWILDYHEGMDYNLFCYSAFDALFDIPKGFGTIMSYRRKDGTGHVVVIIKSNKSYNILDLQSGEILKYNRSIDLINEYFYRENIVTIIIYYNGLKLKPVPNCNEDIPDHVKWDWDEEQKKLTRTISI